MRKKKKMRNQLQEFERYQNNQDFKLVMCMMMHFQGFMEEFKKDEKSAVAKLHCGKCQDFLTAVCPGKGLFGIEVIYCMEDHSACSEISILPITNPLISLN